MKNKIIYLLLFVLILLIVVFSNSKMDYQSELDTAHDYFIRKDFKRYESKMEEIIQAFPTQTDLLIERGSYYFEKGRFQSALKDFLQALEQEKNSSEIYYHLAETSYKLKDLKKSKEYIDKTYQLCGVNGYSVVKVYSSCKIPIPRLAYLRGSIYYELGLFEECISDFDYSLQTNQDYFEQGLNCLAISYYKIGEFKNAVAAIDQLRSLHSTTKELNLIYEKCQEEIAKDSVVDELMKFRSGQLRISSNQN